MFKFLKMFRKKYDKSEGSIVLKDIKLSDLRCVEFNASLNDYYTLYKSVRESMPHPEWLYFLDRKYMEDVMNNNGKIWIYYMADEIVCAMTYIPAELDALLDNSNYKNKDEIGCLGPIMVNPKYRGFGLMNQMFEVFDEYNKEIGKKLLFTRADEENIYSIRCLNNNGYKVTDEYIDERGLNLSFVKELR